MPPEQSEWRGRWANMEVHLRKLRGQAGTSQERTHVGIPQPTQLLCQMGCENLVLCLGLRSWLLDMSSDGIIEMEVWR